MMPMTASRWHTLYTYSWKIAWAFFWLALPVTSFPYFPPAIGGGALVRPLSIYPLIVLVVLVTLPALFRKPISRTLLTLIPFVLLALASSLISLLRGIDPAFGIPVTDRILRAVITLGIGLAIYCTVAVVPRNAQDLASALRWLYAGFSLALLWGILQVVYVIHFIPQWFHLINRLQRYISVRKLFINRVSGMTYEPNWFAEQIAFLLLPWLLASVLTGYSVFRWRWKFITLEWFLLGLSVAVLPFTFSRAGLFSLVALAFLSLLLFRPGQSAAVKVGKDQLNAAMGPKVLDAVDGEQGPLAQAGVFNRSKQWIQSLQRKSWLRGGVVRLLEAGLVVVVLAGLIYLAGTRNEFFARIWGYWYKKNATLEGYFEYLGFGARFTYGETAFRTYELHPFTGVGLGNYAFYFEEMLPDRPLAYTPEVLRLITPDAGRNRLITAKNLYFRLLAETGLAGTAAFMAFLVALFGCALNLWLTPKTDQLRQAQLPQDQLRQAQQLQIRRYWGTGGLLGLIAFLMGAFSFDSFAIPNMWIVFGLITASGWVFMQPEGAASEPTLPDNGSTEHCQILPKTPEVSLAHPDL